MSGTFLCPNSCGFARVAALEISRKTTNLIRKETGESNTKYQARLKQEVFKKFQSTFEHCNDKFNIDFMQFNKRIQGLKDTFNKWNFRKADEKSTYISTFSLDSWAKLSVARKNEHSFSNCKGCAIRYMQVQSFFPVKSAFLKGKAKANPIFAAVGELTKLRSKEPSPKPTVTDIKSAAKAIYSKITPLFQKTFNVSFAEGLAKVSELQLQHKTINERRNDRRNHYRHSKNVIEQQIEETAFLR